jgi:CheY-like chemotaxis protein
MSEPLKPRPLKTTDEFWNKLKIIAKHELRSVNNQILYFLQNDINEYEKNNPGFFSSLENSETMGAMDFNTLKTLARRQDNAATGTGLQILCVEDDAILLNILEMLLKNNNHYPVCVQTPKDAVKEFMEKDFDVVIVDHHLPEMNGRELVIKLLEMKSHFEFIVLTADNRRNIINSYKKYKPRQILNKIDETDELLITLSDITKERRMKKNVE